METGRAHDIAVRNRLVAAIKSLAFIGCVYDSELPLSLGLLQNLPARFAAFWPDKAHNLRQRGNEFLIGLRIERTRCAGVVARPLSSALLIGRFLPERMWSSHPSHSGQEPQMATISPLRQRMIEDMMIRNLSPATQQSYIYAVARFSRHFGCAPDQLSLEQVRSYQLHLIRQKRSWSHVNQVACALRFLYGITLGQTEAFERIVGGYKPDKLPLVLSAEEIARFLQAVSGVRNRVVLKTAYAAGLRVGEVTRLKVSSIDSKRMLIHIENGKGGRDRYAMLSPRLLEILRAYWKRVRPGLWLFPGRDPSGHVTARTIQGACRVARRRARLGKPVTVHTLRHSFATHLLERGVDIRIIQVLLGHVDLGSTARYAQVATNLIAGTGSPFDQLAVEVISPD